jgi:hypothetical protein
MSVVICLWWQRDAPRRSFHKPPPLDGSEPAPAAPLPSVSMPAPPAPPLKLRGGSRSEIGSKPAASYVPKQAMDTKAQSSTTPVNPFCLLHSLSQPAPARTQKIASCGHISSCCGSRNNHYRNHIQAKKCKSWCAYCRSRHRTARDLRG